MIVPPTLCGVVRGQRDLTAFASGLSQAQSRALLYRKGRNGRYQSPKERPCGVIAIDGKALRGSTPHDPRMTPTSKRRNWSAR